MLEKKRTYEDPENKRQAFRTRYHDKKAIKQYNKMSGKSSTNNYISKQNIRKMLK